MGNLLIGIGIIILSSGIGMYLDLKKEVDIKSLYWAIGVVAGMAGTLFLIHGLGGLYD